MEQLGASVLNLRPIRDDEQDDDKFETLIPSTRSLSAYEKDSLKCLLPQIIASIISASFNVQGGVSMAYSSVLISQLEQPYSDFKSTKAQNAFMASIVVLVAAPASVLSGILMDRIGRINTIKTAVIPGILGWSAIALSQNMNIIILGRVLVGIGTSFATNPATVYITEIAHPKLRMSLLQLSPISSSLGMIIGYLSGWYVSWRTLAWIATVLLFLPTIAICFVSESPSWLIFKERLEEAKKSLNWLYKYQPNIPGKGESFATLQYKVLKRQHDEAQDTKISERGVKDKIKEFLKPTGYKPLIIMLPLFFFQHFSGVYVTMFYSIMFIEEAGAKINPYLASSMIGVIRFIMAIINVIILKHVARRKAMFISAFGMAICMFISGLFTLWIKNGTTTATWVPVAALLMYVVFSVSGLMFLPFMITSELFPLEIRGVGYTVGYSLSTLFMFSSIQGYYWMTDVLGGHTNLQWFFAVVALAGLVYSYMFLPETKGKKLTEISENMKQGWLYIGKNHK